MRKKGNTVLAGLIICLLLVFLAAAGKLFGAYLKYQKGDVSYEKLQEYVQEPEEEESPESEKEKEEPKNRYLEIDFAGLKAVNPDVIAWIQIPALDISYPVVQGNFQSVVSGETTPTQLRKNLGMTHSTFYRYRKTFYEKYPELSNSAN